MRRLPCFTLPWRGLRIKRKKKLFYGWVIVAVVAAAGFAMAGQFNPTIGVFIKPITEEFGWSRATFAGANTIGTIVGGLAAIFVGPFLDRYGPRWMVTVGFVVIGGSIAALSQIGALWHFYLATIVGRVVVQGVVNLGMQVSVPMWFVRRRAQAIALAGMGPRLGNGLTPVYAQAILEVSSWRVAMLSVAIVTWTVGFLPSLLFLRRRPEDMGLRPDGEEGPPRRGPFTEAGRRGQGAPVEAREERSYSLREAASTRAFYVLLTVTTLAFFVGAGINFHLIAYLDDQGVGASVATLVLTAWAACALVGGVGMGFIGDRIAVKLLMAGAFAGLSASMLLLLQVTSVQTAFLWAAAYGITFGATTTLYQLVWPVYFGREALGTIRGVVTAFNMTSNALGPLAAGFVFDATESYDLIWWVDLIMLAAVAALTLTALSSRKAPRAV